MPGQTVSLRPDDAANPRRRIPEGMTFEPWAAPDGWTLRRFEWPQPGSSRGSLLFLGGRGDFVEKYLEALMHWHGRGWRLGGFDWRGQGGSGRLLADRSVCHLVDFDPLLRDLEAFVEAWRRGEPGPHLIVAHSMGAHLTLRLMAEGSRAFDAAVLASPMIGIGVKGVPAPAIRWLARSAVALGHGERRIWQRDLGNYGGRMTSCPDRQADKIWWKTTYPEIASGSPSWGWTRAACASIARLRRHDLARIRTPVLLLASRRDPIVDVGAIRRAAALLPAAELEVYPGPGHELLREADPIRLAVLARIDRFLERPHAPN